jgi:hypothetical protein
MVFATEWDEPTERNGRGDRAMVIYGLGRAIHEDRQRDIQKRLRDRGLSPSAEGTARIGPRLIVAATKARVASIGNRPVRTRSFDAPVGGRSS